MMETSCPNSFNTALITMKLYVSSKSTDLVLITSSVLVKLVSSSSVIYVMFKFDHHNSLRFGDMNLENLM